MEQGQQRQISPEERRATRMKKRRAEAKKKLAIMMAVIIIAIVLVIVLICKLMGVFDKLPEESVLAISNSGQIVCEEVTDFGENFYNKADLKGFMKAEIETFNQANSEIGKVTLDKVSVKDENAYAKVTYSSVAAYQAFTGYKVYQGTVAEALEAGYQFADAFVSIEDGEKKAPTKTVDITSQPDLKVVIIAENIKVSVEGKLLYVSEGNTTITGENEVVIAQADGNNDATQLTYIIYE